MRRNVECSKKHRWDLRFNCNHCNFYTYTLTIGIDCISESIARKPQSTKSRQCIEIGSFKCNLIWCTPLEAQIECTGDLCIQSENDPNTQWVGVSIRKLPFSFKWIRWEIGIISDQLLSFPLQYFVLNMHFKQF